MKSILKTRFGSFVYGSNVATSDTDIKGIFLPEKKDILLQRVPKVSKSGSTKQDHHTKNTAKDVDVEIYEFKKYIDLLLEGNTPALDLLFTPKEFYLEEPHSLWLEIQANKHRFLSSKAESFIGYCRTQANKYGLKGSRMNELKDVIDFLKQFDRELKLKDFPIKEMLEDFCSMKRLHTSIVMLPNSQKTGVEPYLCVCNRNAAFHLSVRQALKMYEPVYEEYGHRARQAQTNDGVDFKALYHAVRVINEGIELITTGNIVFPRPERELLLKIRKGELHYKEIECIIEEGFERIEQAKKHSVLPSEPDYQYAEDLILMVYEEIIKET